MAEENQYRNPVGEEGRKVIESMNEHHREVTSWGLSNIPHMKVSRLLDIGCGGGACLKLLLISYPNAVGEGIDISDVAVEMASARNRAFIAWNRLNVSKASVSDMPFEPETFELVTAVETYFFWPDIAEDFKKVAAVLKKGGVFCIVSEQYITDDNRAQIEANNQKYHMKIVENQVVESCLRDAGFEVETITNPDKNWVTYLAKKL